MKKILIITLLSIAGISCQTEELVINNAPGDNLVADAQLAGKLQRMVQYPTAIDNVVDGTACFAIQLPFTVVVNGQAINVSTTADFQTIRNIIAEDANNTDTVAIQFPVSVTYADYTTATFAGQAEFNAAVSNCLSSVELSCINIGFPLGINTYDSQNQIADTFNLNNEAALYQFLQALGEYEAVSLDYPINFSSPQGVVSVINNNGELEAAIDNFTDECLAALDPDPDPPGDTFEEIITSGTWYVHYFFRDQDDTGDYAAYDFTFNTGGTITVTGGSGITGTWATFTDSGDLELDLTFSSSALSELAEDWTVVNYTSTEIVMEKVSGGGDEIRYLTFRKN